MSNAVLNVTRIMQEIELQNDKNRITKIEDIQKTRRRPNKEEKAAEEEEFDRRTEKIKDLDQHRLPWPDMFERFKIDEKTLEVGLSSEEAERRHHEQGKNTLTATGKDPWYVQLFHEFTSLFALLLFLCAALSFIVFAFDTTDPSTLYFGIVIVVVVSISGLITFFQNAKSDSIMEGFKNFIPQMCTAIRDGKAQSVPAEKLVRGDVIEVKEGERVPADIRIISSNQMKVDNSSLTGESDPLLRSEKCDHPDKILETENVAFFGTLCKYGKGRGLVFNISDETIIGQIAGLAEVTDAGKTPLRKEIDRFVKIITIISVIFGVTFFCLGFVLKYSAIQNLIFAIGILIANAPEGLLATVTIALAIAAKKLSRKKVLVKNLESVETLGSTSCICSDKTGTLTQNKMTVENFWYDFAIRRGESLEAKGSKHQYEYDPKDSHFQALHRCAILNSSAVFSDSMPEKEIARLDNIKAKHPEKYENEFAKAKAAWKEKLSTMPYYDRHVLGDASETALVKFFQPLKDIEEMRKAYPTAKQFDNSPAIIPFNSSYKYALHMKETADDPEYSHEVYIKGAPEQMWSRCKYIFAQNRSIPIDDEVNKKFQEANRTFAKRGERVLGFARYRLKRSEYGKNSQFNLKDPFKLPFPAEFEFLGLISLIDPPRESVPVAIQKCKTAGIKVIMVTGDQQLTAAAIAQKIGIFEEKTSVEIAEAENIPYEQALEKASAIVVNGEMLTKAAAEDEGLPDSEKGKKLERWLKKPQIVFARTSPAQKLYIVRGCQRLGYIVAVTGDGVNDSPAIKQADIGIAMGITGSDVAKDAADMVLLNDDFSSIILGIEEGRKIFDNLKKSIAYISTSNISEVMPFVMFVILAVPLPLSETLIVLIDLGTDIFPGIAFTYEDCELDIMTRLPRRPHEHLVNNRLLTFSFLQMGILQSFAGFMCYFIVMQEFGFNPSSLIGILFKVYFPHNPNDVYNPAAPFFGNTNVHCENGVLKTINMRDNTSFSKDNHDGATLDWLSTTHKDQDVRMGFLDFEGTCNPANIVQAISFETCRIFQVSPMSRRPICYSTEALKYAQTSFFIAVVFGQFINSLLLKTRKLSLFSQGFNNSFMIMGWAIEFCLTLFITYFRPINALLGSRDVIFYHFGWYGIFFSMLMLVYDEAKKYMIRNLKGPPNKPNWFVRNTFI